MIRVEDALRKVLKGINILEGETVKITDAIDRTSAEDIYSVSDIPAFNNSAMDGYAVVSSDIKNASKDTPQILGVIDDIKAGDMPKKILKPNQAIRIMTGAPIPRGANSVVMVEFTQKTEDRKQKTGFVKIFKEVKPGENIRKAGENIKKGELVISKGTLLKSAHIGLLASLGKAKVNVIRKPKIAILATGDEIIDIKDKLKPGKIRSSNTYTLYTEIIKSGGIPRNLGIAKDKPLELERKIKQGLDCDLILTSGGVSVGDYDLVKDVLAKIGTKIKFWKIAMRPGKPLVFGMIRGIPVFGLPGNTVSSMVSFEIFVRPAISKMLGRNGDNGKEMRAVLGEDICKKIGFRYFLRAVTERKGDGYITRTTGPQGSGILKSMAIANSLIELPEGQGTVKKGSVVKVRFLE